LFACSSGQTTSQADNEDYNEKFASLKELAEGFDKDASLSGFETNEYCVMVATELETLLGERSSIEHLDDDAESLESGESGFSMLITEPEKIGDTYFRFIELSNKFNDTIMGAINPLYLQYWSEDTIGFHQLSECSTNSGETTSFVDYRIVQDKYISVIELRKSDIVSDSEDYNFVLYMLNEGEIENCVPKDNINTDNGFWEIGARKFYTHRGDTYMGIMLYELGNKDNREKTAIEFNGYGVTVKNIDAAGQAVTLALIDDEWRIQ
jgi:hypothetical protein